RSLLIDRFRLTFHLETRQQQGFALIVAKNGPKLEKAAGSAKAPTVAGITTTDGKFTVGIADAKGADAPSIKSAPPGTGMNLSAKGASMDDFIVVVRGFVGAPLVNETALDGYYDFKLTWEAGQNMSGSLHEQLGLRLEPRKIRFEFFIIDSAEKRT